MSVPKSAHTSSRRCQSTLERARRDISRPKMRPTWPRLTSVTSRSNPTRPTAVAPDLPKSSSMTTIRSLAQP